MNSTKYPFEFKFASILVSLISLGYLVVLGRDLLTPLAFGILLSILLLPIASFFETKLKLPRGLASGITLVSFVLLIVIIFSFLGNQFSGLISDWPNFKKQLFLSFSNIQVWIDTNFHIKTSKQLSYLNSAAESLLNSGTSMVGSTLLSISSILFTLIFVILYTLFLLNYRSLLKRFLIKLFNESNAHIVNDIISKTQSMVRKYITGLLLEMVIVFSVVSIVFWILGIKYSFLLGVITGLFNLIPYIGIFTALLIAVLITFATATGVKVLLVIITIVAMHLIDSNVLLPIIVGSKVKINALMTVIGVVVGEMFWGIPGMFLSIPVIAILKIVFDHVESLQVWGILLGEEEKKKKKAS
jgi:predicted PurR-regulated permease PerM